jgi:hypothetical protein
MANVAMMVVGAVVNSEAFAGGNYLFSMIDKNGAAAEAKRHNAALEKLNQEQADYNIKRSKNLDWLNAQNTREQKATNELYSVNSAFDTYKKLYGQEPALPHPELTTPKLDYTPSDEQKMYEKIFVGAGTAASVGGAVIAMR